VHPGTSKLQQERHAQAMMILDPAHVLMRHFAKE